MYGAFAECLDTVTLHGELTTPPQSATKVGRGWAWKHSPGVTAEVKTANAGGPDSKQTRYTLGPEALWLHPIDDLEALFPDMEVYGFHYAADYHVPHGSENTRLLHRFANWSGLMRSTHRHSFYPVDLIHSSFHHWSSADAEVQGAAGVQCWRKGLDGTSITRGSLNDQQICLYLKTADHETCTGHLPYYLDAWTANGYPGLVCFCGTAPEGSSYKGHCPTCDHWYHYSNVVRLETRFGRPFCVDTRLSLRHLVQAASWTKAALGYRATTTPPHAWLPIEGFPVKLPGHRSSATIDGLIRYHRDRSTGHLNKLAALTSLVADGVDQLDTLAELLDLIKTTPEQVALRSCTETDQIVSALSEYLQDLQDEAILPRSSKLRTATEHRHYTSGLRRSLKLAHKLAMLERFHRSK